MSYKPAMRVAFYIPYPIEGPSTRFRVYQFFPYLEKHGVECEVFPFLHSPAYRRIFLSAEKSSGMQDYLWSTFRRAREIKQARTCAAAFVHLNVSPVAASFFARKLVKSGTPIIFDFDDAQFLKYASAASKFSTWLKSTDQTRALLEHSRHAIAGNEYLAAYARQHCERVSVIPTCLDTDAVRVREERFDRDLVVGWMGSSASTRYLRLVEPALVEILQRHQNVRVRIIGARGFSPRHERMQILPWSLEEEAVRLHEFDLGLMPLGDEEYSKGKCGFKALQYMSVGVPAVVSPVGVNTEIVKDGVNGFLASSTAEWIEKISRLIENPPLRKALGRNARKTVEEFYSVRVHAPRLLEILKNCARTNASKLA